MGMILVTIPMIIATVLNPVISFKSDRFRSRWGRRIPFILVTLPPLVGCLLGLGYGEGIAPFLRRSLGTLLAGASPAAVAVGVIGVLMVAFSFFNTFVNSVFWYLFNDVVPERFLARFMSMFRMVSLLSVSLYNFFVFPFAGAHAHGIFIGAAILYTAGFGLMCLKVKEGTYPPPPENVDGRQGVLSALKTFLKECHSHWHYRYLFLSFLFLAASGATLPFTLLFYKGTGLDLEQIGQIIGLGNLVNALVIFASGWLADRYHPVRIVIVGLLMNVFIVLPATCLWLFWHPSQHLAYLLWMVLSVVLAAPANALIGVCDPPMLMRMFPRDRYGQFCSANAMWRSLGAIIGGTLAGAFLDLLKRTTGISNEYAFIPVWQLAFHIPAVFCSLKLYRSWQQHGGDAAYVAPLPQASCASPAESSLLLMQEASPPPA
jgi:MFS family permease